MNEPFLTTRQLARRWGLQPATLKRMRTRRTGPEWIHHPGHLPWGTERIRYPLHAVLAYEAARSITPIEP
jgi:hypothetical protein